MNPENRTWRPIDPEAGNFPEGLESALGDGDSVSACVVVLVDSEIDRERGAQASLAVAKRWAASGRRIILADACLDHPVLHEAAGVENGEGISDMVLYGASLQRIVAPVGEGLLFAPAGTPVVRVADVLKHVKLDMVISGCKEVGATLVFHVSTGTPGAQALTERAEGVLTLHDPEEAVAGAAEKPVVEPAPLSDLLAEPRAGASPTKDVLAVEGSPGLPEEEESPAFSVDDSADSPASEGEEGETSDAFSLTSLEGYDAEDSALEPDEEAVAGAAEKPVVEPAPLSDLLAKLRAGASPTEDVLAVEGSPGLPEEEESPAFSVDDSADSPASEGEEGETSDAFSLTSLEGYDAEDSALEPDEEAVAGAAEKPVVEPAPLSDLLAKPRAGASPTEDVLAVEGSPGLPEEEESPAFSVDDSADSPASEGEEGETSDAFSLTSLEGYDAEDSALEPDEGLGTDVPEAGAVISEAEESTETTFDDDEGGDGIDVESAGAVVPEGSDFGEVDLGLADIVDSAPDAALGLAEPVPVSDSPAELGAEASPIEEQQRGSTEADAEAGRETRLEKWRRMAQKTARKREWETERETDWETEPKTDWRVVLAEDDDDYALIIERALTGAAGVPVEIRRARTGHEALDLLRDFVPDLLLLDLKMPGMGGHEALEEIKGDDVLRSVPVAILTSSDRDDDMAKSYGIGSNHFITKPSTPLELEAKLGSLLRNLSDLGEIRRGSAGASATAVSAVDPESMIALKALRWAMVVGVLIALYVFGKILGGF